MWKLGGIGGWTARCATVFNQHLRSIYYHNVALGMHVRSRDIMFRRIVPDGRPYNNKLERHCRSVRRAICQRGTMGSHGHGGGNLSKELKKDPIAMQTSSPWVSGLWDAAAVDHSEKWTVDFVCG